MKKILKPETALAPLPPVLVSCGDQKENNIITICWAGITCSEPAQTYISVRRERFSHHIVSEKGTFVINLPTRDLLTAIDFCGVRSGRDVDKFSHLGLTPIVCEQTGCVAIKEAVLSIECKVDRVIPLGSHDMFMATIVSVIADDSIIGENGRLDFSGTEFITYAKGKYLPSGESVAALGFSVKGKEKG